MPRRVDAVGTPSAARYDVLDWAALVGIVAVAAWLRLRDLNLVEFKLDEATAVSMARRVLDGDLTSVGLVSSVGARNPPLFIYLTAIPLAIRDDPLVATAFVGLLATIAVGLTFVMLRPRSGRLAAATAAGLFATAPWAVLYGRKIWAQDVLPLVTVLLLWTLFSVTERHRTKAVAFVPVLLCLAFQLNFSAVALVVPAAAVLAYRAREVDWRAATYGSVAAVLLLAPWLARQLTHGLVDASLVFGGGTNSSTPGHGAITAASQALKLTGSLGWSYVTGTSTSAVRADVGARWDASTLASGIAGLLLIGGIATAAWFAARSGRRISSWPYFALTPDGARRVTLLVWLGGVCAAHLFAVPWLVAPHYLIVAYPVTFALQGMFVGDVASMANARLGTVVRVSAVALVGAMCVAYCLFTLGLHDYLDREGGVAGGYGVVYRDEDALAVAMRARRLRVKGDNVLDFLVTGRLDAPFASSRVAVVTSRFSDEWPPRCTGKALDFGPLRACLPQG